MLSTLLESKAHRTRASHFMVASATVHAAIIFAAVYATATGAAAEARPDEKPEDPITGTTCLPAIRRNRRQAGPGSCGRRMRR